MKDLNLFNQQEVKNQNEDEIVKQSQIQKNLQEEQQIQQDISRNHNQSAISNIEVTPEMKKNYENIFNNQGVDAANNWLKQQIINNHLSLQMDNEALIKELQEKHTDLYAVPIIREAIQAFMDMDLNPNLSLRDQGFHDAMEHIANIYKAGYEAGLNLKNQNDSAKARLTSAVNSAVPHYQSNKTFTRAEIRSMSPDDFIKNEKAIFEQLGRGLIK